MDSSSPDGATNNISLNIFWWNTWKAWQTGKLISLRSNSLKQASAPFLKFKYRYGIDSVNCFLNKRAILKNEFYIDHNIGNINYLMTNLRLWLLIPGMNKYVEIYLADIKEYDVKHSNFSSSTIRITLNDGQEYVVDKMRAIISEGFMQQIMQFSRSTNGWLDLIPQLAEPADLDQMCGMEKYKYEDCFPLDSMIISRSNTLKGANPEKSVNAPQAIERFNIERAVFILIIAVAVGVVHAFIYHFPTDWPPLAIMFGVGFLLVGFYVTAEMFFGIGGFFQKLPSDAVVAGFDGKKILREPLLFLVVIALWLLISGAMVLWKNLMG